MSPACHGCGAPIAIDLAAHLVRCDRCGQERVIDAALQAELRRYVGDVKAATAKELTARFHAAFHRQNARAAAPILLGTVGVAIALAFGIGAFVLAASGDLRASHVLLLAFIWLPSLAAFAFGWARMFNVPTPTHMAAEAALRCDGCGAVACAAAGEPLTRCPACGGTVLVPMRIAARLLFSSDVDAERALSRRGAALAETRRDLERYVAPLVAVVCLGVPSLVGLSVWLAMQGGPIAPASTVIALFLVPLCVASPFLVLAPRRAARAREGLQAMIERVGAK